MLKQGLIVLSAMVCLSAQNVNPIKWIIQKKNATVTCCRAEVVGMSGNQTFDAAIEMNHGTSGGGHGENYTFNIVILKASSFKALKLADLEADAGGPISEKMTLVVKSLGSDAMFKSWAQGHTGYNVDTFTFENSCIYKKSAPIYKLYVDGAASSENWMITITNPFDSKQTVTIPFDFVGAHDFLQSCLH
jgi:hypothetical protein